MSTPSSGDAAGSQFCFVYELRPGAGPEYARLHQDVPSAVRRALSSGGAHDYSIFLRGDLVISTLRASQGLVALDSATAGVPEQAIWAQTLRPLFARTNEPDGSPLFARQVFRLD